MDDQDPAWFDQLPVLPQSVREIVAIVNDPATPLSRLVEVLARDPVASARVVAAANTAFFARHQAVHGIDEAALRLGMDRVRVLVTATLLAGRLRPGACPGFDPARFWRASMTVALCASKLANYVVVEREAPAAYLAGLLHNIGLLAAACAFPDPADRALRRAAKEGVSVDAAHAETLGVGTRALGAQALRHWGLPEAIVVAVEHQHDPAYGGEWSRLATLVGVSAQWRRGDFQGRPDARLLRGISNVKLENIGASCRREVAGLGSFAASLAAA